MASDILNLLKLNIRKYRKKNDLTQLKLSILTGISKDYITAIESGKRTPSIKRLLLISKALKTDFYKFFQ